MTKTSVTTQTDVRFPLLTTMVLALLAVVLALRVVGVVGVGYI
jgi:hypothetical protein